VVLSSDPLTTELALLCGTPVVALGRSPVSLPERAGVRAARTEPEGLLAVALAAVRAAGRPAALAGVGAATAGAAVGLELAAGSALGTGAAGGGTGAAAVGLAGLAGGAAGLVAAAGLPAGAFTAGVAPARLVWERGEREAMAGWEGGGERWWCGDRWRRTRLQEGRALSRPVPRSR
jgi:hypothetical protein